MIIDEINKANVVAMKEKDVEGRVALGVLKNKIMLATIEKRGVGETLQESDVINIIMKVVKELTEESENYVKAKNNDQAEKVLYQKSIVEKFLPKMMSEQEIISEISKLEDKSLPFVMKYFKSNFAGKVDMGMVKNILTR